MRNIKSPDRLKLRPLNSIKHVQSRNFPGSSLCARKSPPVSVLTNSKNSRKSNPTFDHCLKKLRQVRRLAGKPPLNAAKDGFDVSYLKPRVTKTSEDEEATGVRDMAKTNKHFKKQFIEQHAHPSDSGTLVVGHSPERLSDPDYQPEQNTSDSNQENLTDVEVSLQKFRIPVPTSVTTPNNQTVAKNIKPKKRKRKSCRSQFRHENIRVYKLGREFTDGKKETNVKKLQALNKVYAPRLHRQRETNSSSASPETLSNTEESATEDETKVEESSSTNIISYSQNNKKIKIHSNELLNPKVKVACSYRNPQKEINKNEVQNSSVGSPAIGTLQNDNEQNFSDISDVENSELENKRERHFSGVCDTKPSDVLNGNEPCLSIVNDTIPSVLQNGNEQRVSNFCDTKVTILNNKSEHRKSNVKDTELSALQNKNERRPSVVSNTEISEINQHVSDTETSAFQIENEKRLLEVNQSKNCIFDSNMINQLNLDANLHEGRSLLPGISSHNLENRHNLPGRVPERRKSCAEPLVRPCSQVITHPSTSNGCNQTQAISIPYPEFVQRQQVDQENTSTRENYDTDVQTHPLNLAMPSKRVQHSNGTSEPISKRRKTTVGYECVQNPVALEEASTCSPEIDLVNYESDNSREPVSESVETTLSDLEIRAQVLNHQMKVAYQNDLKHRWAQNTLYPPGLMNQNLFQPNIPYPNMDGITFYVNEHGQIANRQYLEQPHERNLLGSGRSNVLLQPQESYILPSQAVQQQQRMQLALSLQPPFPSDPRTTPAVQIPSHQQIIYPQNKRQDIQQPFYPGQNGLTYPHRQLPVNSNEAMNAFYQAYFHYQRSQLQPNLEQTRNFPCTQSVHPNKPPLNANSSMPPPYNDPLNDNDSYLRRKHLLYDQQSQPLYQLHRTSPKNSFLPNTTHESSSGGTNTTVRDLLCQTNGLPKQNALTTANYLQTPLINENNQKQIYNRHQQPAKDSPQPPMTDNQIPPSGPIHLKDILRIQEHLRNTSHNGVDPQHFKKPVAPSENKQRRPTKKGHDKNYTNFAHPIHLATPQHLQISGPAASYPAQNIATVPCNTQPNHLINSNANIAANSQPIHPSNLPKSPQWHADEITSKTNQKIENIKFSIIPSQSVVEKSSSNLHSNVTTDGRVSGNASQRNALPTIVNPKHALSAECLKPINQNNTHGSQDNTNVNGNKENGTCSSIDALHKNNKSNKINLAEKPQIESSLERRTSNHVNVINVTEKSHNSPLNAPKCSIVNNNKGQPQPLTIEQSSLATPSTTQKPHLINPDIHNVRLPEIAPSNLQTKLSSQTVPHDERYVETWQNGIVRARNVIEETRKSISEDDARILEKIMSSAREQITLNTLKQSATVTCDAKNTTDVTIPIKITIDTNKKLTHTDGDYKNPAAKDNCSQIKNQNLITISTVTETPGLLAKIIANNNVSITPSAKTPSEEFDPPNINVKHHGTNQNITTNILTKKVPSQNQTEANVSVIQLARSSKPNLVSQNKSIVINLPTSTQLNTVNQDSIFHKPEVEKQHNTEPSILNKNKNPIDNKLKTCESQSKKTTPHDETKEQVTNSTNISKKSDTNDEHLTKPGIVIKSNDSTTDAQKLARNNYFERLKEVTAKTTIQTAQAVPVSRDEKKKISNPTRTENFKEANVVDINCNIELEKQKVLRRLNEENEKEKEHAYSDESTITLSLKTICNEERNDDVISVSSSSPSSDILCVDDIAEKDTFAFDSTNRLSESTECSQQYRENAADDCENQFLLIYNAHLGDIPEHIPYRLLASHFLPSCKPPNERLGNDSQKSADTTKLPSRRSNSPEIFVKIPSTNKYERVETSDLDFANPNIALRRPALIVNKSLDYISLGDQGHTKDNHTMEKNSNSTANCKIHQHKDSAQKSSSENNNLNHMEQVEDAHTPIPVAQSALNTQGASANLLPQKRKAGESVNLKIDVPHLKSCASPDSGYFSPSMEPFFQKIPVEYDPKILQVENIPQYFSPITKTNYRVQNIFEVDNHQSKKRKYASSSNVNYVTEMLDGQQPPRSKERLELSQERQNPFDVITGMLSELQPCNTLTPEQYVNEMKNLHSKNCPKAFLEFYTFITKKQIASNQHPISFKIFLEFQNAGKLKTLEKAYEIYTLKHEKEKTLKIRQ